MKVRFVLFLAVFFWTSARPLSASVEDFIITEIMYDPAGADGDKEWIEIFHNATDSAIITGGSVSNSLRFYDGQNRRLASSAFQGSLTIEADAYFILAKDAAVFMADYPSYSGTLIEVSAMSLGNTSDPVGFRQGFAGELFGSFSYDKSWGGSGTGRTIEKKVRLGANDSSNWVEGAVDLGTPGLAYTVPLAVVYSSAVRINEFLANPSTGAEWVELYNASATETVSLTNWQVDDIEGGSSPQSFSATLNPLSFFVIYFSSAKLNNESDSVSLIRPDNVISDSINYTKSTPGYSWAFTGQAFAQTSSATPGQPNIFTVLNEKRKDRLWELKRLPLGSPVELEAYVTTPENLLGEKDFYVTDKDDGIKISYSGSLSLALAVGDKISVASTIEESYAEKYIKTTSVSLLEKGAINIEARKILTGEVAEANEGLLVKLVGTLQEQSGETFYINDGSGRAKIYIKESTGIVKPKMSRSDRLTVVGIVSQYGFLESGEPNYRVMPRFQSDIVVEPPEGSTGAILGAGVARQLPVTGGSDFYSWGRFLIFVGLCLRVRLRGGKMNR